MVQTLLTDSLPSAQTCEWMAGFGLAHASGADMDASKCCRACACSHLRCAAASLTLAVRIFDQQGRDHRLLLARVLATTSSLSLPVCLLRLRGCNLLLHAAARRARERRTQLQREPERDRGRARERERKRAREKGLQTQAHRPLLGATVHRPPSSTKRTLSVGSAQESCSEHACVYRRAIASSGGMHARWRRPTCTVSRAASDTRFSAFDAQERAFDTQPHAFIGQETAFKAPHTSTQVASPAPPCPTGSPCQRQIPRQPQSAHVKPSLQPPQRTPSKQHSHGLRGPSWSREAAGTGCPMSNRGALDAWGPASSSTL